MNRDAKAATLDWLSRLPLFVSFVGLYLALDVLSFTHPQQGLYVMPWNPAPALGLVFLIRLGPQAWLPLAVAVVLAELATGKPADPPWASAVAGLVLTIGYILLGQAMARQLPRDTLLDDRRTLVIWLLSVAVGTLLISLAHLFTLHALGLLPATDRWTSLKHLWVGDGVGIAVMMPLMWCLSSKRGRKRLRIRVMNREAVAYLLLGVATLWLAFGIGGHSGFKLFYLLFLPLIWAAARQGMGGAMVCAAALQIGVIVAMRVLEYSAVSVAELQTLALAMTVVGFFVGAVVSEQRRTSQDLRQSLRLAAAGEMAGALTHELHHPLTALSAYARTCQRLLGRGETGEPLRTAVDSVIRETDRARDVLRRLQEFFRTGTPKPEAVTLAELVESAVGPFRVRAEEAGVRLRVAPMPEALLMVDRLQMEVVLRSLLANAFEAVSASPRQPPRISVAAWNDGNGRVSLRMEDSGSGLSYEEATHLFDPMESIEAGERGLALAISHSIVATHGGRLWAEVANHGVFKIELPLAEADTAPPPTRPVPTERGA